MRLPVQADGKIDELTATTMIRHAVDSGVNYIDTAYPYHEDQSEPFIGKVLADGYRERVYLATKLPIWDVTSREDMDKFLNEQLARLATDHIDFYLIHGLRDITWETTSRLGVLDLLDDAVNVPVYHPLIGYDKEDTIEVARKIGTFDLSIMQIPSYCCAIPFRPATTSERNRIDQIEKDFMNNKRTQSMMIVTHTG